MFIQWSVRPEILEFGPFRVRWYGLLFGLAFLLGYGIMRWFFSQENKPERDLGTLLMYLIGGTLIGARIGEIVLYEPDYYFRHPLQMLAIWNGGLASHGGAVGILVALYLYTRRRPDQPYLWLLDRIAVPAALAGCLIRIGNLFNSEILGVPTRVPWAVVFSRVDEVPRHPVQLYESAAYAVISLALLVIYRRGRTTTAHGLLFGLFLVTVFSFRFGFEFLKQRQEDYDTGFPLRTGQWLSIPFVLAGAVLLWRAFRTLRRVRMRETCG